MIQNCRKKTDKKISTNEKCGKFINVSNRLDIQATHCLRLDSSLEHNLKSAMSSQKPRKSKQKSLLSWVGPLDNKANVEDENAEKSCDAEMPERSSENGQDYATVKSVIETVGSLL